jgi:hypothetical protein
MKMDREKDRDTNIETGTETDIDIKRLVRPISEMG